MIAHISGECSVVSTVLDFYTSFGLNIFVRIICTWCMYLPTTDNGFSVAAGGGG